MFSIRSRNASIRGAQIKLYLQNGRVLVLHAPLLGPVDPDIDVAMLLILVGCLIGSNLSALLKCQLRLLIVRHLSHFDPISDDLEAMSTVNIAIDYDAAAEIRAHDDFPSVRSSLAKGGLAGRYLTHEDVPVERAL